MSKGILFRNYFLRFGTVLVERLSGFILAPLLIANIGVAGYGEYGLASGVMLIYVTVLSLRFPMAMIRFFPDRRDQSGDVLVAGLAFWLLITLVSGLVLLLAPATMSRLAFGSDAKQLLLILASSAALLLVLYEFVSFSFRAESRFGLLSVTDAGERIVFLGLCVLLFARGYRNIEAVIGLLVVTSFTKVAIVLVPSLHGVKCKLPTGALVRRMFTFCLPFLPHLASIWLIERSAFFLMARQGDTEAVGFLTLSFTLAAILLSINAPLQTTLYPLLRRYYDDEKYEDVRELINASLRFASVIGVFGIVSLVFGTTHLLRLFGIGHAQPPVSLIFILAAAFLVGSVRQVVINVLHISHNTQALIWISPLGAVVSVLTGWALVGQQGPTGAGVAILLGTLVQTVAMFAISPKYCIGLPDFAFHRTMLFATMVAIVIQYLADEAGSSIYWVGFVASGLLYLTLLWAGGGLTRSEKNKINGYFNHKISRMKVSDD